jgi:hypothetical protein
MRLTHYDTVDQHTLRRNVMSRIWIRPQQGYLLRGDDPGSGNLSASCSLVVSDAGSTAETLTAAAGADGNARLLQEDVGMVSGTRSSSTNFRACD